MDEMTSRAMFVIIKSKNLPLETVIVSKSYFILKKKKKMFFKNSKK